MVTLFFISLIITDSLLQRCSTYDLTKICDAVRDSHDSASVCTFKGKLRNLKISCTVKNNKKEKEKLAGPVHNTSLTNKKLI